MTDFVQHWLGRDGVGSIWRDGPTIVVTTPDGIRPRNLPMFVNGHPVAVRQDGPYIAENNGSSSRFGGHSSEHTRLALDAQRTRIPGRIFGDHFGGSDSTSRQDVLLEEAGVPGQVYGPGYEPREQGYGRVDAFVPFAVHGISGSSAAAAEAWLNTMWRTWGRSEEKVLQSMHPAFRAHIRKILATMRREGLDIRISDAFRHPKTQAYLEKRGKSQTDGFSYHNGVRWDERTKSLVAVAQGADLRPANRSLSEPLQAKFYKRLREVVNATPGLRSGGDYSRRSDSPWSKYDIGWDPGHVEMTTPGGMNALRKKTEAAMQRAGRNQTIFIGTPTSDSDEQTWSEWASSWSSWWKGEPTPTATPAKTPKKTPARPSVRPAPAATFFHLATGEGVRLVANGRTYTSGRTQPGRYEVQVWIEGGWITAATRDFKPGRSYRVMIDRGELVIRGS